jgi:transcription elongation factor S-II
LLGDLEPQDVATQIENELFDTLKGTSREYKAKVRSLTFNLKNPKNPALRQQVLGGFISPQQLCSMSTYDMASEELKKERQRMAEYHLEAAKLIQFNQTSTDMFKCSKCGKRETTYYQMQTRRLALSNPISY